VDRNPCYCRIFIPTVSYAANRNIAQAVSRFILTVEARVQSRGEVFSGQNHWGTFISRYSGLSLPLMILSVLHTHHVGWCEAAVSRGSVSPDSCT
jgi:hypothetical protein